MNVRMKGAFPYWSIPISLVIAALGFLAPLMVAPFIFCGVFIVLEGGIAVISACIWYEFNDDHLHISGAYDDKITIPYSEIRTVRIRKGFPTRDISNGMGVTHIVIESFGRRDYRISPKDIDGFIGTLKERCGKAIYLDDRN